MFTFWLLLGRIGFFRYDGLEGFEPAWWPRARVLYGNAPYPDCRYSKAMPIGNAVEYARIFKGDVVPLASAT